MSWRLHEAKKRLSELVKEAGRSGPQVITVHGKVAAVVMSADEYRKLKGWEESMADFFLRSPLRGSELIIERDQDFGREVEL